MTLIICICSCIAAVANIINLILLHRWYYPTKEERESLLSRQ